MPKGTSRDEATLNSEKIKPIALAVIELCLSERVRQAGRQLVSQKTPLNVKKFVATHSIKSIKGHTEGTLGLVILANISKASGWSLKPVFWSKTPKFP